MEKYKSLKGLGTYYILGIMLLVDALILLLVYVTNSYILTNLLKVSFVLITIYQFYYVIHSSSINYILDEDNINIVSVFGLKNVKIPFNNIEGYKKFSGKIRGVKLTGFGYNYFAFGKSVIEKIGTTVMFVTHSKNMLYIKTSETNYAISPENIENFESVLNSKGINTIEWNEPERKSIHIYKNKKFYIPFLINSILIVFVTLRPFVLYLLNKLPAKMPLNFDAAFHPVQWGTGKQFAFNQMIYGVLNMGIIFCVYYATYFYSKYDKKNAYKIIYLSLIVVTMFLIFQTKILNMKFNI